MEIQTSKKTFSTRTFKLIVDIIILVVGIIMLAIPTLVLSFITIVLGIVLLGYGVISIILLVSHHLTKGLSLPIILAVLGAVLLIFNNIFANTLLPFAVGLWMLIMGVLNLVSVRKMGLSIASTILSCLAMAVGIIILVGVFTGGNALSTLLGVCMVVYGAIEIVNFIMIGKKEPAPF